MLKGVHFQKNKYYKMVIFNIVKNKKIKKQFFNFKIK